MENKLVKYISKLLKLHFLSYPKRYTDSIDSFLLNIKNELSKDVTFKHPGYKKMDLYVEDKFIDLLQVDTTLEAILLYRLERNIYLNVPTHPLLPYLASLMKIRTGAEIYYSTDIGAGFQIQHGVGIVIGPRNRIGKNFMIHQGVTIGQKHLHAPGESAIIGDNVTIFAGAKILGSVIIGDNVQIGANAVLLCDAEPNSIYAGVPAKKKGEVRITNKKD